MKTIWQVQKEFYKYYDEQRKGKITYTTTQDLYEGLLDYIDENYKLKKNDNKNSNER